MNQPHGTTILSTDEPLVERIASLIGDDAMLTPITVCDGVDALGDHLSTEPPGLVLYDITADPDGMLEALPELVEMFAHCRFVVIADDFDKQQLFHSMQAGARHFLPKEWVTADMLPVCRELLIHAHVPDEPAASGSGGSLITVLSASGGCGATLIALNLAAELGELVGGRALLADLDVRFGGAATHLGLTGEYGVADVLDRGAALDPELVRSTAIKHGERLSVLLSPATISFDDPKLLNTPHMEHAVSAFRGGYPFAVIDAPMLTGESAVALAEMSTATIVVLEPTVKDIRNARAILAGLAASGVEGVTVVLNRCRRGQPVSPADVASTLELESPLLQIPDDPAAAVEAMHEGKLLMEASPKSKLRKQIATLAETLRADESSESSEDTPAKPAKGRGLFGRKAAA